MIGIDSQVQQRVDQFRGKPQELAQQYQMSRQLIDLLALQKLKSEKDAVARNMMVQMQQNPQTIAQQREAELMGRTQQEIAQQVGGIAQLAEARKQQNLQRMASGQRPPVQMAQGGVARFAGPDGSYVDLDRLVRAASEKYRQLSPELLRAVIAQESSGNPRVTSKAGARGLMQLMPATARDLGVTNPDDLYDPAINIDAGARYLNQLLKRFGGDTAAALSAYHSGPGRVSRLRNEYGDDYVDQLGPVGQRYAADVLNRIELSPGAQEQLAASVTRMPPPTVTTTVTPEPPRDTARRQTEAFPVGELDSLRESLSGYNTTPQRQVDPVFERQVATRMEPSVGDIREALFGGDVREGVVPQVAAAAEAVDPSGIVQGVLDAERAGSRAVGDLMRGERSFGEVFPTYAKIYDYILGRPARRVGQAVGDLIEETAPGRRRFEQRVAEGFPPTPPTQEAGRQAPADVGQPTLDEIDTMLTQARGTGGRAAPGSVATAPPQTPADLRAAEEDRVRKVLDQDGIMGAYQDMVARQRALAGRLQDPREQRLDRLAAALRGGAGRSTFGMTGAGMSAGAAGERRRQNALAQELLDKEFGITREQLGAQLGIGKEALAGGRSVFEQSSENIRAAANRTADAALADRQLRLDLAAGRIDAEKAAIDILAADPVYQGLAKVLQDAELDGDKQAVADARAALEEYRATTVRRLSPNLPVAIRRK